MIKSSTCNELDNVYVCKTPCDVSEGADVTILMLTDAEAVDEVVFGADGNSEGLANNLKPGSLLIDMGTTSVLKTRAFATKLEMSGLNGSTLQFQEALQRQNPAL